MDLPQLRPPERLLCGPGPTNVDPAVLNAMSRPMLGHLDPALHEILLDVVDLLRRVYRAPGGLVLPLGELGAALKDRDTLLMADCVTSLAGIPLEVDAWGVDFAYACTQKCLAAPPGMSPVAVSERAMERLRARKTPVPFSFDLLLLERYWIERPAAYHHTAPILGIYALHEALCQVLREGLEERWARHEEAARHLQTAIEARGLALLANVEHRLAPLTAVRVPDGVDGKKVQGRLLRDHGIEIGGGLGPDAPSMWRIGLMGRNASVEAADRVLAAPGAAPVGEGAPAPPRRKPT